MKHVLAILFGFLLTISSQAQQLQPAQLTITPMTLPEVLQVLDNTGTWATIGTVNPTTHSFLLGVGQGGTGTATPSLIAGPSISIAGAWPNQTINNTSPFATLSDPLPVAHGGTGTTTPGIVAGSGVSVSGIWPNQTVSTTADTVVTHFGPLAKVTAATAVCRTQGCTPTGTGYGASVSGTLTLGSSAFVCSTPPVLNVTTNAGGNITTVNSVATQGQCTAMGGTLDEVWTVGGGLSAGSGATFSLTWAAISQTWTPVNASTLKAIRVFALAGGGQGGGGADTNSGTATSGGAGGGAGGNNVCTLAASQVVPSQQLFVGLGGRNGGTPATTAGSDGTSGQFGIASYFGGTGNNFLNLCGAGYGFSGGAGKASATISVGGFGGGLNPATGALAGIGGGAGGSGVVGGNATAPSGGAGGGGSTVAGVASAGGIGSSGGGSSGGGVTTALIASGSAAGGNGYGNGVLSVGGAAVGVNTNGNNGAQNASFPNLGPGGDNCSGASGGGAGLTNTVAGNGGYGCFASGGGGGGSVVAGASSAAGFGGYGGDGEIWVIESY